MVKLKTLHTLGKIQAKSVVVGSGGGLMVSSFGLIGNGLGGLSRCLNKLGLEERLRCWL